MAELPSGTVTFLMTDVERSTALWEGGAATMDLAIARHDQLFDDMVVAHGGVHLRERGEGDSLFGAFERAGDGVAAALAIQRAYVAEHWPTPSPLRIRIGIHTGEVTTRAGDYYGASVNRCARIRGIAHGGQVLLSEATAVLVRDSLPSNAGLRDLGFHRLRYLERPERVFQLLHPDLPSEFPPLASMNARPHNLPIQPTALIGREQELASVCALFTRHNARLVTLTGPGGVGKTRLALQVAADLLDVFADGVSLVNLASIRDPGLVASTIAQALDVRGIGSRPILVSLKEYLQDKERLLLLDNFEQVSPAGPLVAELLAFCPRLKVLITSRSRLHLRGERELLVPPLALPRRDQDLSLDALSAIPAVALFVERARDVRPDLAVMRENASVLAEICHRLDGLPLAIELAAARVKLFSLSGLLARLAYRSAVLVGGPRDLPARQQTMRDAIAWSYELLSPREQALFRSLSIFSGGCSLRAANRVCESTGDLELDPEGGLAALVEASLMQRAEDVDGEQRFEMLETVREFGFECLTESGELAAVEERHTAYFLAFAKEAEAGLSGARQTWWLARLEREHNNFRTVLGAALKRADHETSLRLAACIWRSWRRDGYLSEGRAWLSGALTCTDVAPAIRAKALIADGELACALGDTHGAVERCQESLRLCGALGDLAGKASSLHILGWSLAALARTEAEYRQAAEHQEACLALQRELGDRLGEAKALHELGEVARYLGEFTSATAHLDTALNMRRTLGDVEGVGWSLHCLAWAAYDQRDFELATRRAQDALSIWRRLGHELGIATTRSLRARIAWRRGDVESAIHELQTSLRLWPKLQHRVSLGFDLQVIAALASARRPGRWGALRAARLLAMAEALRGDLLVPLHRQKEADELQRQVNVLLDDDALAVVRVKSQATSIDRAAQRAHTIVSQWRRPVLPAATLPLVLTS